MGTYLRRRRLACGAYFMARRLDDIRERRLGELRNPDQTHIPAFDDPDAFIHLKETSMNVSLQQLPPTRVDYLRYIGAYGPGIADAWIELCRDWLPKSGPQFDPRPAFERYPADAYHDVKTGELECEICIPVKGL
ncbi:MAG: GyrI-like domain-containing protein [Pseudomonas sp.]|nr:GyrI-like domain-containing protein [Pseudomonas sp.]